MLRLRGGPSAEAPPPPGGSYTFPDNTNVYPRLPTDGGTASANGFIDVTNYGATGNGTTNDTVAIQNAIFLNRDTTVPFNNFTKKTLFFPNGTYLVGGSLGLNGNLRGILQHFDSPNFLGGFRIQGESESGTIIRLIDNSVNFQDAANPRYVIFQSNYTSSGGTPHRFTDGTGLEGYWNYLADITVDLGAGNPGACGVNVMMHNVGNINRVTVQDAVGMGRTTDQSKRALIGFDEYRQGSGPNHLSRLTVKGCQYGFRIGQSMCGQGIEHLKLDNQGTAGILVDTNALFVRGVFSTNDVPVALMRPGQSLNHFSTSNETPFANSGVDHAGTWVYDDGTWPVLLVVDATLLGTGAGAASLSAIRNQVSGGKMFLRNIITQGYAAAAQETTGVVQSGAATITEYATSPTHNLYSQTPVSLNLPIRDTPDNAYPALSQWTSATSLGVTIASGVTGANQGTTLQAAIDNCPTEVLYFPPTKNGNIALTSVPGNVLHFGRTGSPCRHIVGHGMRFAQETVNNTLRIEHPLGDGRPVIIEGCFFDVFAGNQFAFDVEVATPRDVVFINSTFTTFRNTAAVSGDVFIESMQFALIDFDFPQDIFIRGWDVEAGQAITHFAGGNIWVLYAKTENTQRMIDSTKFVGGTVGRPSNYEQLGGWHGLVSQGDDPGPLYMINNPTASITSQMSLAAVVEGAGGAPQGNWATFVRDEQNGVTQNLSATSLDNRGNHKHLVLFRSKY